MNKVAFVTGGSGSIGSKICKTLAGDGWLTAIGYNSNKQNAQAVADEICSEHFTAHIFKCDVSDNHCVENAVAQIKDLYGSITLLINCAGAADINLFTDLSDERISQLININLTGAIRVSRAVLPQMLHYHKGNIINITSVWGEKGASCEVVYSAAKAGLIGLTKALARETAPNGIRVNCVSCGMIDSKMNSELSDDEIRAVVDEIAAGRIGTADDVAAAVRFLSDKSSSYINGQTIRVDGCWI